ncbi:hypothetical protein ACWDSD_10025 [Streptomyces spiralis]
MPTSTEWTGWSTVVGRFREAIKKVDHDWSPHGPRHWFATTALSNGLPLLDVSGWLGRKSIKETADTFGHLTPDSTGRAVKATGRALTRHRADLVLTDVA